MSCEIMIISLQRSLPAEFSLYLGSNCLSSWAEDLLLLKASCAMCCQGFEGRLTQLKTFAYFSTHHCLSIEWRQSSYYASDRADHTERRKCMSV